MHNNKRYSDEELLIQLKVGKVSAFDEIYNRYWSALYSAAYKRVKCQEVAEEIVQDIFTSLWINRVTLNVHSLLSAYFYTCVRYQVLNYLHKETVRRNYKESFIANRVSHSNSTEEVVLLKDMMRTLDEEVKQLPSKCRSVFELSRKEFKTNKEIAAELDISEKTVENHLTKALRRLRVRLNDAILLFLIIMTGYRN